MNIFTSLHICHDNSFVETKKNNTILLQLHVLAQDKYQLGWAEAKKVYLIS